MTDLSVDYASGTTVLGQVVCPDNWGLNLKILFVCCCWFE